MALITSKSRAAEALDTILRSINTGTTGGAAGYLRVYTGSAPANVNATETGTLLAQCTLIDGGQAAFGAASLATVVANGYTSGSKWAEDTITDNTGLASWFRVYTHGGSGVLQGSVGMTGSPDLLLNTTGITVGGALVLSYFNVGLTGVWA